MGSVPHQFDHLATYSDCTRPGITRLVFTKRDVEARAYIKDLMRQAGLSVREDVMGNTFGRWEGSNSKAGLSFLFVCLSVLWGAGVCQTLSQTGIALYNNAVRCAAQGLS